jgi:hypothetical protein
MPRLNNNSFTASGDLLWTQDVYGSDGAKQVLAAQIRAYADGAAADSAIPGRFEFWTSTSGGTLTKALTLDASQAATFVAGITGTNVTASALLKLSGIETGLTAHAGGGQGSALALSGSKSVHNVTTVGTAADSVALPLATGSGAIHIVKNSAASNSMQLFGSGTDTIDGVATGTGVAVAAGKCRICVDFASGTWLSLLGA